MKKHNYAKIFPYKEIRDQQQEAIDFAEAFKKGNEKDPFELTNDTTVTIH